jgi:GTP cyclohydrolase II
VPLRVRGQCVTSEVFGSLKCDCRLQLEMATQCVKENVGCVIYLQQEGRGIGLANKVAAHHLQERGLDTVDANRVLGFAGDYRTHKREGGILADLKIESVKLLTNNPREIKMPQGLSVFIVERLPILALSSAHSAKCLLTKEGRMGHIMS